MAEAPYKSKIEALAQQARDKAESIEDKENVSDLQQQRANALNEFADTLESAMDDLENGWEA